LSGDFGNESVKLSMIAARHPQSSGFGKPRCLAPPQIGVARSRPRIATKKTGYRTAEFAGETHGYGKLDFPALFNCGGQSSVQLGGEVWKMPILSRAVRVTNFKESTNESRQRRVQLTKR